jgi:hypothetical protein
MEDVMVKIEAIEKYWNKVLLGVLTTVSIMWITPAHAVGPFFENESSERGQLQGPNSSWPRPETSLWSPPVPLNLYPDTLKKGDIILRSSNKPDKTEAATKHVVDAQPTMQTAQR